MKVLFLCGSLEPGRDGVGDYTRRFAAELVRQGNIVCIIALHDSFTQNIDENTQNAEGITLPVLRISQKCSNKKKFESAKKLIKSFNPDLISLQFVPFAFHPKGLSLTLNKQLKSLGKGKTWHVMIHELWVGMAVNDTLKFKFWGSLQKILIKHLLRVLNPQVIHSQCDLYINQLRRAKYSVTKLPLFSNIDVYKHVSTPNYKNEKEDVSKSRIVFFGALHPFSNIDALISKLEQLELKSNFKFEVIYLGRNGVDLERHLSLLKKSKIHYEVFGELSPEDISALLSSSKIGISTGSPQLLEKNGTVAAMVAHKLPIICIGKEYFLKSDLKVKTIKGVYSLQDIEALLFQPATVGDVYKVSNIVSQFVEEIRPRVTI